MLTTPSPKLTSATATRSPESSERQPVTFPSDRFVCGFRNGCGSVASALIKSASEFVFFNDTATTEIYTGEDTLSLHDALP
eukprot:COSAG01_NODE_53310_length_340_cov_0.668050_1_plen_80_part_10